MGLENTLTKREYNYLMLVVKEPLTVTLTRLENELSEAEAEIEDTSLYLEVSEQLEPEIRFVKNLINKLNNLKQHG